MVKIWGLILSLVMLSMFLINNSNAQQGDYVIDEKIIGGGGQCSADDFIEIGSFVDGGGLLIRHCIKRGVYDNNDLYVVNSYFEFNNGLCADGGDEVGFFYDLTNRLIFLCVDKQRGENIPEIKDQNIVKNTTITNSSECPSGYRDTGIDIDVEGYTVKHCNLGGKAGGGLEEVTRERCEGGYAGAIPNLGRDECIYDLNSPDGGSEIGYSWNGASVSSGENCPSINCTCMGVGSFSTNGWNCTSVYDENSIDSSNECLFSNVRWTNDATEEIISAKEDENLLLIADVNDVCEVDREVKCDIYKYTNEILDDLFHTQAHGYVNQKEENGAKNAYCKWTASKLEGSENDENQLYYFKMWFADNETYKSEKSDNIEILNRTAPPPEEIFINWSTSIEVNRNGLCPEGKFIISVGGWKMRCAELTKSNGGNIVWGSTRIVEDDWHFGQKLQCGVMGNCPKLDCEGNEAAIGSFNNYKIECAVMEDEEGTKVGMRDIRTKTNGCNKNEVVVGIEKDMEVCADELVLGGEGRTISAVEDDNQSGGGGLLGGGGGIGGLGGGLVSALIPIALQIFMRMFMGG